MSKHKFSLIFLLFLLGCQDIEIGLKDYPRIKTNLVSDITSDGAQFSAKILDIGLSTIVDYGFVWGSNETPTFNNYKISSFQQNPIVVEDLEWTANITTDITSDIINVRAYIQSENFLVYGNVVQYTGKGSAAPRINDFTPDSCSLGGKKIVITGEYFSQKKENIKVFIDNEQLILLSVSSDRLVVLTPPVKESGSHKIIVEVNGVQSISDHFFKLIYPWEKVADFPAEDRDWVSSFIIDDFAYVGGGIEDNYGQIRNDYYKYNPIDNNWSGIQDFSGVPRYAANCIDQKGVVFFGTARDLRGYNKSLYDAWKYDPESDQWSELINFSKPDALTHLSGNISVYNNNLLYVYFNNINQFWVYDFDAEQWDILNPPPVDMVGDYVDPYHYLRFGTSRNDNLIFFSTKLVWSFNPDLNTWSKINNNGIGIYDFRGIAKDDKAYFYANWYGDLVIEYDFEERVFLTRAIIPKTTYHPVTFILNDNFYIGLGGSTYSFNNREFWKLHLNE